jgi:hypothetical protein
VAWFVRPSACATAAGVAVALLLAPPAAAVGREAPAAGPLAATGPLEYVHGAALARETSAMRTARARTRTRRLATEDGYSVDVEVTSAYADNPVADQALVDFLGSRLHGPELGALRVYVGHRARSSASAAATLSPWRATPSPRRGCTSPASG